MAGITLEQAQKKLDAYLAAAENAAAKKTYTMPDGRSLTHHDIDQINRAITFWDKQVKRLSAGGGVRRSFLVPR